jgi:hypothetical protein
MFESTAPQLAELVGELARVPSATNDDAARIDVIAALEKLKAVAAAVQLQIIADFAASQEAANKAVGIEARQARRGIPEQIGLARKVSPASAAQHVSRARALIEQLPETFGLLRSGQISEHVATIVVTETSHLAAPDRRLVDKKLAEVLPEFSPRRAEATARRLAIEADPPAAVRRASNAREDRRVGIRPAPDTMALLSALLPCEQGVAAYAALLRHTDTHIGNGDPRTRGQIMADTLVERLTGQATADDVSAEIGLIMTDEALFSGDDTPAELTGYGPVPAEFARALTRRCGETDNDEASTAVGSPEPSAAEDGGSAGSALGAATSARQIRRARVFLRRLFTDPVTGIIVNCDPRRRRFDGVLAKLLVYRDQHCRDPYCDAPIRHLDHIETHASGGPTTATNGRGLCERGNYVRTMPGFTIRLVDRVKHIVETTTPTGHTYQSGPPPAPSARRRSKPRRPYRPRM